MAKTASDLADQISELTERLEKAAKMEVRRDIADELLSMIKKPEGLRPFLLSENATTRSYLPQVDGETFRFSEDFLLGIKFVCAALKDKDFDY